jgi:HK97 gp10 family phage protein
MAKTTTQGLEAMRRKMAAIPRHIRAQMEADLAASADELVGMQKRLAPVDSGDLRDSIRWVRGTVSGVRGMRGALTGETVDRNNMIATVFTTSFKAALVEFGTAGGVLGGFAAYTGAHQNKRGRRQRRTHGGTAAQPFFFPAYRALKRRIKSRISRGISKAIKAGAR